MQTKIIITDLAQCHRGNLDEAVVRVFDEPVRVGVFMLARTVSRYLVVVTPTHDDGWMSAARSRVVDLTSLKMPTPDAITKRVEDTIKSINEGEE